MTRRFRAIACLMALVLTVGVWAPAQAAYTPDLGQSAGNRLLGLQIIKGKYQDDALALKDEITRAELITVIVRAFGQEANAALLNGAAAYPDSASHWASGNIAMAKALVEKAGGDAIGMPDGSFAPDAKLTPAQSVAFLMKFLGVKADATKAWPASYLDVAVDKGIITADDAAQLMPMSNDNATRGLVFYLFDNAFSTYDIGAGKTFYTKYVDPTAPVLTLDPVIATTTDTKVIISGKVEGATELTVGGQQVRVGPNGHFTTAYPLPEPGSYTIAVVARDLAGNTAEAQATLVRLPVLAGISVEPGHVKLEVGGTATFKAIGRDRDGNPMELKQVEWSASSGSMDGMGNFTATEAGTVSVTATVKLPGASFVSGATVTVAGGPAALRAGAVPALRANGHDTWPLAVSVVDAHGATVLSSQAPVTVRVAEGGGLTVNGGTVATVNAEGGVATFTLQATTTVTEAGKLVITSGDLTGTELSYTTTAPVPARILLHAGNSSLHVGSSTTITIRVEDHYGNAAQVAGPTKVVISGGSTGEVTIPAGGTEATFSVHAGDSGSLTVTAVAQGLGSDSLTLQVYSRPSSGTIDGAHSHITQDGDVIYARVVDINMAPITDLAAADFIFHGWDQSTSMTVMAASYDSAAERYTLIMSGGISGDSLAFTCYVKGVPISGEMIWPPTAD